MLFNDKLRYRCRNPRCRGFLKDATDNSRHAFCCEGCYVGFYRRYCLVCEEPIGRTSPTQKLCGRRKCRRELSRDPSRYASPWEAKTLTPMGDIGTRESGSKNQAKPKGFWGITSGRGWCWEAVREQHHLLDRDGRVAARFAPKDSGWSIAHPRVHPELPIYPDLDTAKRAATDLVLCALPLDRTLATRLRATNARQKARRKAVEIEQPWRDGGQEVVSSDGVACFVVGQLRRP